MSKNKAKGTRFETGLTRELEASGVPAQRQPMSGALADWPGDVMVDPRGARLQIECKHHKTISHYDRLEKERAYCEGVLVTTPSGRFYWMEHNFMLDALSRAISKETGSFTVSLESCKFKTHPKNFDDFIQACDFLVVRPNNKPPRWWMSETVFWSVIGAAFGEGFND